MRFQFPDGLTCIVGPNGSGKSTFIEAIGYALWGPKACIGNVGETSSRGQAEKMSVFAEGWFPTKFNLLRSSSSAKLEFTDGGLTVSGARDVGKYFSDVFVSWDMMLATFFAKQQCVSEIVNLPPTKRRILVASFLGLGIIDSCVKDIGTIPYVSDMSGEIDRLEKELATLKEIDDVSIEVLMQIQNLRTELVRIRALEMVPEQAINALSQALEAAKVLDAQVGERAGQIRILSSLKSSLSSFDSKTLVKCPVCRSDISDPPYILGLLDKDLDGYRATLHELTSKRDELQVLIGRIKLCADSRSLSSVEAELNSFPAITQDINLLLTQISRKGTLSAQASQCRIQQVEFDNGSRKKELREAFVAFREHMLSRYTVKLQDLVTAYLRERTQFKSFSIDDQFEFQIDGYPMNTYSRGQQDLIGAVFRVAAAQLYGEVVFGSPAFMVFDSSFDALDVENMRSMLDLLENCPIKQVIVTSHNEHVASRSNVNVVKIGGLL